MSVVETDVVIVGAGPVGLTLANLLARLGVSAVVLERMSVWEGEPRAVALDDDGLRVLQAAGLHEHISELLLPDIVIRYVTPSGRCILELAPTAKPQGLTPLALFHQPWLERDLRANLAGSSRIDLRHEHEVVAFTVGADEVEVTARGPGGSSLRVRGRYLVGCDGARSMVRKGLGVEFRGASAPDPWLVIECEDPTPHKGSGALTTFFCRGVDAALTVPLPSGLRRWEFLVPPGRDHAAFLEEDNIASLIRGLGGTVTPVRRKGIYVAHARQAVRFQVGRAFLAGDAAHVTPPFAGQGLNSGLRDAANLAWKLEAALNGRLSEEALATYDIERRRHVEQMTRMAINLGRLIMAQNPVLAAFRDAVLTGLRSLPPVDRFLREARFKSEVRLSAGVLHPTRSGRRLVGRRLAQPRVTDVEGATHLLDEVVGLGWALLGVGATPHSILGESALAAFASLNIRTRLAVTSKPVAAPELLQVDAADWPWFAPLAGCCVLVRPDRIVAAVLTAAEAPAALAAFGPMLRPDARQAQPALLVGPPPVVEALR